MIRYNPGYRWIPSHQSGGKPFAVTSFNSSECPAGIVTNESRELIQLDSENRAIHKATGATLCGPDASQWPAWWFDAVTVIEQCRSAEEAAHNNALSNAR